jgi:hypothetical protein
MRSSFPAQEDIRFHKTFGKMLELRKAARDFPENAGIYDER